MYMTPATIRKRFFSVLETAEKNSKRTIVRILNSL